MDERISNDELAIVAAALEACPNLEPVLTPVRAFTLVGLLQLAEQFLEPGTYCATVAREMAEGLIYRLGEHDQAIAALCNRSWEEPTEVRGLTVLTYSNEELIEIDQSYRLSPPDEP